MSYESVKQLINSTLQGKEHGHEILPSEHQAMLESLMDYIRQAKVTGQSIMQGYLNDYESNACKEYPETPDNAMICYVTQIPTGVTATFEHFDGVNSQPLSISCPADQAKFAVLLWNKKFWEHMEKTLVLPET